MKITERWLTTFVATSMFLVTVGAMAATPTFAKKPKGATAFTIKTNLDGYWGFWGTFRIRGVVEDVGDASFDVWDYDVLAVYSEQGTMLIQTYREPNTGHGTFLIFAAEGVYSGFLGVTGWYTQKLSGRPPKIGYPEGFYTKWHLYQTLEGSVPEH